MRSTFSGKEELLAKKGRSKGSRTSPAKFVTRALHLAVTRFPAQPSFLFRFPSLRFEWYPKSHLNKLTFSLRQKLVCTRLLAEFARKKTRRSQRSLPRDRSVGVAHQKSGGTACRPARPSWVLFFFSARACEGGIRILRGLF